MWGDDNLRFGGRTHPHVTRAPAARRTLERKIMMDDPSVHHLQAHISTPGPYLHLRPISLLQAHISTPGLYLHLQAYISTPGPYLHSRPISPPPGLYLHLQAHVSIPGPYLHSKPISPLQAHISTPGPYLQFQAHISTPGPYLHPRPISPLEAHISTPGPYLHSRPISPLQAQISTPALPPSIPFQDSPTHAMLTTMSDMVLPVQTGGCAPAQFSSTQDVVRGSRSLHADHIMGG